MRILKYTIIKNRKQYDNYCKELEQLSGGGKLSQPQKEESELLTLLIETWDNQHNTFSELDPVQLLKGLMDMKGMKASTLATKLGKSKSLLSDILNYNKAFSKEMIRDLAGEFKVSQEAFNREYSLRVTLVELPTIKLRSVRSENIPKDTFTVDKKRVVIQPKTEKRKLVTR